MAPKLCNSARRSLQMVLVTAFALLCASCGGVKKGLSEVNGKVLYKGEPAVGAQVIFHPEKDSGQTLIPSGAVDEDGSFTLFIDKTNKGAPPGKYYVFVRWPDDAAPDPKTDKLQKRGRGIKAVPGDFLQGRYCDHKNPKFHAEVNSGRNDLPPFEVQ
jgi:hypothetical protein